MVGEETFIWTATVATTTMLVVISVTSHGD
jgi:hypothetical protein